MDRLSKEALRTRGVKKWERDVRLAVKLLQNMFWPDYTVLGGGSAKHLTRIPPRCRRKSNRDALQGAERVWCDGFQMLETAWRVEETTSDSR